MSDQDQYAKNVERNVDTGVIKTASGFPASEQFGDIADLSNRLYEINVQDKLGNETKALTLVEDLNNRLKASSIKLRCWYSHETEEYLLHSTALYEREDEEN